jgi:hypothetical protein
MIDKPVDRVEKLYVERIYREWKIVRMDADLIVLHYPIKTSKARRRVAVGMSPKCLSKQLIGNAYSVT